MSLSAADISASPAAPPAPTPRKRVVQACQPCGIKKVKCDGILPTCSPCQKKGVGCTYGTSKRVRASSGIAEHPRPRPSPSLVAKNEVPRFHSINHTEQSMPPHILPPILQQPRPRAKALPSLAPEISTRLIQTYFKCLHPLWPILYKPLYSGLDYGSPSDLIPPALVAAMFAIASCIDKPQQYATNTVVQRYPEPWQFFEDALDLLQYGEGREEKPQVINALTPSITNCQVLTILSLQQHGVAEYSRAAILCGLASAMAVELRLHRNLESSDPIQSEITSRLWWNLYILDKMLSTEMGRPVVLRYEECDCPFPSVSEADEFELMSIQNSSEGHPRNTSVKLRTISGLHSTIRLTAIMERICSEIYGVAARKDIRDNPEFGESRRMALWQSLKEWEHEMGKSPLRLDLSQDLTSVPAAITNYVIMWQGIIMIHRPFITRWVMGPNGSNSPSLNPLQICLDAANNICLILEKYFDRLLGLPCDMVFSIFTAASTLAYHLKRNNQNQETSKRLSLCIHWLSVLAKSWKTASARHQALADTVYDLPRDVMHPRSAQTSPMMEQTPSTSSNPQTPYSSVRTIPNGGPPKTQTPRPEDWTFLRDFGDSTDEFYELDVELRGLLNGGFEVDTNMLLP